jgi:hypothetical protein
MGGSETGSGCSFWRARIHRNCAFGWCKKLSCLVPPSGCFPLSCSSLYFIIFLITVHMCLANFETSCDYSFLSLFLCVCVWGECWQKFPDYIGNILWYLRDVFPDIVVCLPTMSGIHMVGCWDCSGSCRS